MAPLPGMPPILPAPSRGARGGGAKITLPQLAGPPPGMPPILPAPQRSAPNRAPVRSTRAPIQLPQTRPSAGGSDAATSGPNYGAKQANAFKQSPAYRQAILDVFQHQPAQQKIAIVHGAQQTPSFEGNLILQALHGGPVVRSGMPGAGLVQYTRNAAKGPSLLSQLGQIPGVKDVGSVLHSVGLDVSTGIGKIENVAKQLNVNARYSPVGQRIADQGFGAGALGSALVRSPVDIARASLEAPSSIPKTVTGLGSAAIGGLAGIAALPVNMVQEGAGKALSKLVHGFAQDYKQRYGPLVAGNDQAYINRLKQQGAGPEVLDLLGVAGGLDTTVGRAIVQSAKARDAIAGARDTTAGDRATFRAPASGPAEARGRYASTAPPPAPSPNGFFTRPRPGLRTSGGDVRPQQLADTALRVTAQRAEDKLRAIKESHRPGEIHIQPGANQVRPLFGNRSQRILSSLISTKYRRAMQEQLNREVRLGAALKLVRLSAWEKRASTVVQEGFIPLDRGAKAAQDAIDARMAGIVHDRAGNPLSPGNHIPPEFANQVDELKNLQQLRDNVGKWLTPRLKSYVDGEGARAARIEAQMPDSALRAPVAEARRRQAQGEMLGEEHPDVTAARAIAAAEKAQEVAARSDTPQQLLPFSRELGRARNISQARSDLRPARESGRTPTPVRAQSVELPRTAADYQEMRPGLLKDYNDKVRLAAQAKGWPEPSFVTHHDVPQEHLGNYTTGTGHAAMPGFKKSEFALWRGGAVDRTPSVYVNGLARSTKIGHQWALVDEQMRRSAFPEPSASAIERAGLGGRRADTLTGREYARAMQFDGHKLSNLQFYNPGRLRESTLEDRGLGRPHSSRAGSAPPELEADPMLHDAVKSSAVDGRHLDNVREGDPFVKTQGWKALPRSAYKEIHSSLQPSGFGGRLAGKTQGLAAKLILGGSPSFLVMNTLAHAVLATAGTRGRVATDAVKYGLWWHGLDNAQRDIVRANAGGRGPSGVERLGSTTPHALAQSWQNLKDAGIGRFTVGSVGSHLNPVRALFKAEDFQSNHFRQMVYYSAAKRAALSSMAKDMSLGADAMNRLQHVFTVGPKQQIAAQIANLHTAEELGRYTVNMMGDYARFTSFERKFINNRAVLFYSFLRHATRTLLYELPLHHPIATALVGEMAKLHNDEVKKMLGGANLPYANSRLFFESNGKLTSIDFNRASPVGSAVAGTANEGLQGLAQIIPPEFAPVLNMLYKSTPSGAPVKQNAWTLLNNFGSLSYPYRLIQDLHYGATLQQSDSVPFLHERPQTKKTAAAQAYQTAKQNALEPNSQRILGRLLGLYPVPDDTGVVAAHQVAATAAKARAAAKKAGKTAWYSPSTPSQAKGWWNTTTTTKPWWK